MTNAGDAHNGGIRFSPSSGTGRKTGPPDADVTRRHQQAGRPARTWSVAVHNDYRMMGENYTFWLFTKNGRAVKGEGRTDGEALDRIRAQLIDEPLTTHE